MNRWTGLAVVLLLVGLALVGVARSASSDGPQTRAEREHAIAASLRCPTCQGLSVADSNSPLSRDMRRIIDQQVGAGRSDEQVRSFFVDRYGPWVLLSPPAAQGGWLVWAVPLVVVVAGLVLAAGLVGRRRQMSPRLRWAATLGTLGVALAVLMATNLGERKTGDLPTGNLPAAAAAPGPAAGSAAAGGAAPAMPGSGTSGPSAPATAGADQRLAQLQRAVARTPEDVSLRLALASTAFQLGSYDLARQQADQVLERRPRDVDALMLRGLTPSSRKDPVATRSLETFLKLAPRDHPAVPLARQILRSSR